MATIVRKAIIIIGVTLICSTVIHAQTNNDSIQILQKRIMDLELLNFKLLKQTNSKVKNLEQNLSSTMDSLGQMKKELAITNSKFREIGEKLESQINQLNSSTNSGLSSLNEKITRNTQYLLAAVIIIMLFIAILIFWLKNKLTKGKPEYSEKLKNTFEALREEQQIYQEFDHSLALKVADEIIRIQKNLSHIEPETKGLKQIEFALERIQDYFIEYGYEMVDMINKPYDRRMKISAKFKPDKNLKPGEQIITRIIKPQICYNGVIIQSAEVEVSIGEMNVS